MTAASASEGQARLCGDDPGVQQDAGFARRAFAVRPDLATALDDEETGVVQRANGEAGVEAEAHEGRKRNKNSLRRHDVATPRRVFEQHRQRLGDDRMHGRGEGEGAAVPAEGRSRFGRDAI